MSSQVRFRLANHHCCPFSQRIRIALAYREIPYEFVELNPKNKPQWFIDQTPENTKIPTLLIEKFPNDPKPGVVLDSQILLEFVDMQSYLGNERHLWPRDQNGNLDALVKANVDMKLALATGFLNKVKKRGGLIQPEQIPDQNAKDQVSKSFVDMNRRLPELSLQFKTIDAFDVAMFPFVDRIFHAESIDRAEVIKGLEISNFKRFYEKCLKEPAFKDQLSNYDALTGFYAMKENGTFKGLEPLEVFKAEAKNLKKKQH